jgi:hypothetical protein
VTGYPLENARFQWREGERRVRDADERERVVLDRVADDVVAELRRRLGGAFELAELADLYGSDVDWAHALAARRALGADSAAIVDAAFARYAREAADHAGGKRVVRTAEPD